MYEAYFGLRERPFSIAPDPRYLYLGGHHREALAHLLYGVHERGGFVQLTGEVGTGKTTVTRALLEQLPDDVDVAFILNPHVTVREFLAAICQELGVELPKRGYSTEAIVSELSGYLLDAFARGRHTVILIDEAQALSPLVLEQIRFLTNLETNREKLLQIILVGQPELKALLARPELRQVAQRITARYHLTPLSLREVRDYVRHRTTVAGVGRALFTETAIWVIHRASGGIPRLINVICDRALLGAYAADRSNVGLATARRAAREVKGRYAARGGWRSAVAIGLLLSVVGAASLPLLGTDGIPAATASLPSEDEPEPNAPNGMPKASLDARLRVGDLTTDLDSAFEQLFSLWRAEYRDRSTGSSPCEQASEQRIRCFYEKTELGQLIGRGLPALIELVDTHGDRHRAVLVGARKGRVVLSFGATRLEYSLAEVGASYAGDAITLWRPPELVDRLLTRGTEGPAVAWLNQQLARVEGISRAPQAYYDETMEQRVKAFQRSRSLTADGIVGESTLFALFAAAPAYGTPALDRE